MKIQHINPGQSGTGVNMFLEFLHNMWAASQSLALWLLIGLAVAGALHVWVPDNFIKCHLGHQKGLFSIFKAVMLGVPLPLCSCGVIPAALGIKKQGAGNGASVGFLISTPQTGVDSIMVSGSMLGFPFALFKVLSAFILGFIGGVAAHFLGHKNGKAPIDPEQTELSNTAEKRGLKDFFSFAIDDLLKMIWKWLVAGIIISAAITTWLPQNFFQSYLPENNLIAMLLVLAISLPMYVCATASVPIAAALVYSGMPVGAALVFLMAGPASNVATIGAVYRALGWRNLLVYLLTIIIGSIGCGLLFQSILPETLTKTVSMHHDSNIISTVAVIILLLLIIRFIIHEIKQFIQTHNKTNEADDDMINLKVGGITCQGCVKKLTAALTAQTEVNNVNVSIEDRNVTIWGKNLNTDTLKKVIIAAGFALLN
jgi:uncharacterized membrane protein YraQ (UPF0718 family)/copper chaperone CopZ